jgi:hypothetical protein
MKRRSDRRDNPPSGAPVSLHRASAHVRGHSKRCCGRFRQMCEYCVDHVQTICVRLSGLSGHLERPSFPSFPPSCKSCPSAILPVEPTLKTRRPPFKPFISAQPYAGDAPKAGVLARVRFLIQDSGTPSRRASSAASINVCESTWLL